MIEIAIVCLSCLPTLTQVERVSFRDDHSVLVGDKPFFPLGLYYCYEEFEDPSGKLLDATKQFGFNTLGYYRTHEPTWREELDRVHQRGLKVWIRGHNGLAVDSEETAKKIEAQVQAIGTHPALLFWEFQDEPLLNKVPVDQSEKGQAIVRRLDPNHPIATCEWPGAVSRFAEWKHLGDIYGTDLYPIPRDRGYGRLPNHDITQMRDYLTAIRDARGSCPMMLVLQAWNWEPLNYGERGYPTPAESRFMAYQSVIHGAKALFYYGQLHCTRPNSASALYSEAQDPAVNRQEFEKCVAMNRKFWETHKAFFQELPAAARIFVLRDAPPEKQAKFTVENSAGGIESLTKQSAHHLYVLAVNASDKPATVRCAIPAGSGTDKLHVLFENRQLAPQDGAYSDTFEPYGVHVYSTAAAVPE